MIVPGSNLLSAALNAINSQTVLYYKANGRTLNSVKQYVTTYDTPVSLQGSFQFVARNTYQDLGLDFSKVYAIFYVSANLIDIRRDVSSDQIFFNSQRYQCLANNSWYVTDGWVGAMCVLIGNEAG